jgi:cation diffusion facilitator family transporter
MSATGSRSRRRAPLSRGKSGAALVSVISNSLMILLKLSAGIVTGSIAIITEAIHSSVDLLASFIALFSVRKADQPADADHPYGHEKAEHVAAGAEAMLILVGAGIVAFEAGRRLLAGAEIDHLGFGIAVIGFSAVVNFAVSGYLYRQARSHDSAALEGDAAHLRTDALTSVGVLAGLVAVELTGLVEFDSIAALAVAAAIVVTGLRLLVRSGRVLMDEAPPAEELDRIEAAIAAARPPEMAGYHKLRARQAGARRHVDMHVQFRSGTTLERAHDLAHLLRDEIERRIPNSEVLIHVEPEASLHPPGEPPAGPLRGG